MSKKEDEAAVKKDMDELRTFAQSITMDAVKDGNWFHSLLHHSLDSYSKKVNAGYFREKYPGIPADGIVDLRIKLASNYSAIEGFLTSSAYSAAIAATIGSGGGASPVTVPGGVASFTIDLFFTAQIQLRLAYDIATLYGTTPNLDDPIDLVDILRVAFGVKAGELASNALKKAAPEAVRTGVKTVVKGPLLAALKALPIIGKHLLQRNIIKFAIPFVTIPLSSGINYLTTRSIGLRARSTYRERSAIKESANQIDLAALDDPKLLLHTLWMVTIADGKMDDREALLFKNVVSRMEALGVGAGAIQDVERLVNFDREAYLSEVRWTPREVAAELYRAACLCAAVDGTLHKKEIETLKDLAHACDIVFDESKIREDAKRWANGGA